MIGSLAAAVLVGISRELIPTSSIPWKSACLSIQLICVACTFSIVSGFQFMCQSSKHGYGHYFYIYYRYTKRRIANCIQN